MSNTTPLQVVALALYNPIRDRYLIVRRNEKNQSGIGHWEFPGGKIEQNETHKQALIREIKEELSFTLKESKLSFVRSHIHRYPAREVEIHLYKYESVDENVTLVDHDQLAWVNEKEIQNFELAPADIPFIKNLF